VLYSYASMGFNNDRPAVSFMLFTQALIQARVPFDIIFDEHLKDLSKYRVLVLADQECLDDKQMELIREYVERGGGLVATEQSSLYTARRLRRPDFGLKDLFKVSAPPWRGPRAPEKDLEIGPAQNRISQGRCSYIPAVKPAIEKPPAVPITSQYWKLPLNWEEMIEQVRWAAGGKFSLEVEAQEASAVVAELQEQVAQERRLVHLLNYAAAQGTTVSNASVEIELPEGKEVREVTLLTPDRKESAMLPSQVAGGRARFTVPHFQTYALAVIQIA
jgi:Beta-galactosidase trimerisation domain